MRKRIKRLIKRLLKTGGLFVLIGVGVVIGLIIGVNTADRGEMVIVGNEYPRVISSELAPIIEQRVEEHVVQLVEQRTEERFEIPPIPTVPPIPSIPSIPDAPATIYLDRSPSFLEVVNGIGTVLASFGLIGLGAMMIVRGRRAPKEKTPESLAGK